VPLVLHEEGLYPVVVTLLVDPIGDGHRLVGHMEALAEGPGEALQQGAGQGPQGAVEVLDRLGYRGPPGRSRPGLTVVGSRPWPGSDPELGKQWWRRENQPPADSEKTAALLDAGAHHPGPQHC
jgi:hypothetical protein